MFDNIGWGEILVVLIIGLLIIGPERLPKVIEDVRAALFAARKAINNAKKELNGEFDGAFDEFREPLGQVAKFASMSPRAALTKHLLDGDDIVEDVRQMGHPEIIGKEGERQDSTRRTHQAQGPAPAAEPNPSAPRQPGFTYGQSNGYNDVL
ncbi:MAG: Sec-independent protein translocase protein TatB [Corynebacterium sp.]|nr:Sec-independent protein translocase protein TatB [Corynebacterium sp.]